MSFPIAVLEFVLLWARSHSTYSAEVYAELQQTVCTEKTFQTHDSCKAWRLHAKSGLCCRACVTRDTENCHCYLCLTFASSPLVWRYARNQNASSSLRDLAFFKLSFCCTSCSTRSPSLVSRPGASRVATALTFVKLRRSLRFAVDVCSCVAFEWLGCPDVCVQSVGRLRYLASRSLPI